VQARIIEYAKQVGWTYVRREEAEARRGFDLSAHTKQEQALTATPYFGDVLHSQILKFNETYKGAEGALVGELTRLTSDITGNREMLAYLRNQSKYFDQEQSRELDLYLIDYDDIEKPPSDRCNIYEVTEEFSFYNRNFGVREDVVFLVNGIPVLVIECKSATKEEAIALGVDQIRRYHDEAPEIMVPQMIFTATDSIGFSYGVTWNTLRRNIFNWKDEQIGNLEAKIKSFCDIPYVLRILKDLILFAEKDEELNKYILRQHQANAIDRVVSRALDSQLKRGLVWHTQGSGKTYTMIKSAELLFKANAAAKPTVLLMIDRNELEDHMIRNLTSLGIGNVQHADRISTLNALLAEAGQDYRGLIVTTIQKFRDMPANLNTRENIYVFIDEAHRTTGGDLGTYLMAGLPNATLIGFTGTPIDKTEYGKGTFKVFGVDDPEGYLHKYSMKESIEDKTTLPLYYNLAPSELLVPADVMEAEFFGVAESEGITDIEELDRILERAVNLRNFLKGRSRVETVAKYVAEHYANNVEPLGYKAFLVAVDREACVLYKDALDRLMAPEKSAIVFTGDNNDRPELKRYHIDDAEEKSIRKAFTKPGEDPKILIVTQKLLTGFDAPILYAMYLDKPMRDHTLLQAIARVNRPYENEEAEMVKPHGFVLDFVGIFDKLERALAFDSEDVDAIVKDLRLLKVLFKSKMESIAPTYLVLVSARFDDKDVDNLIEHFRDKGVREQFFKEYREIEMLYEIISPDAFLRPFIDDYTTLSAIFAVVRRAYAKTLYVDRAFQKKTNELVQRHVGAVGLPAVTEFVAIDENTIEIIGKNSGGDNTKVINLVKSIEKKALDERGDPFLVALADRARAVQESFEDRQTTTADALDRLLAEIQKDVLRREEQAAKGLDSLTYFVQCELAEAGFLAADEAGEKIASAFQAHPSWRRSDAELREVRQKITFTLLAEDDDIEKAASIVDKLISSLQQSFDE